MDRKESTHPMVAVPEALRVVLRETAQLLLQQQTTGAYEETIPVGDFHRLHNRILAQDVVMREPGYPPYAASIMDGFAVASSSSSAATTAEPDEQETSNEQPPPSWTHTIRDKVFAGDAPGMSRMNTENAESSATTELPAAYYITTGAAIPEGCDCVVPIEDVTVSDDQTRVRISADKIAANKWIRAPGCDMAPGETVLVAGSRIDSVALGLLQQSGHVTVTVRKQITVGVLSTGNELLLTNLLPAVPQEKDDSNNDEASMTAATTTDWWKEMKPGTIPDVNRPVLLSLLASLPNVNVADLGMVSDDNVEAMVERIKQGCQTCDVILTTGGISMGETDIVEHVLVERLQGRLHFGRLHMKPGKPTTFVSIPGGSSSDSDVVSITDGSSSDSDGDKPDRFVFAMPGNPVSAVVCTHLLVLPCLQLLTDGPDTSADTHGPSVKAQVQRMVENALVHSEVQTVLQRDMKLDMERPEYHRVTIDASPVDSGGGGGNDDDGDEDGTTTVRIASTGVQRSSRLMSLRDAEGLLVLPQGTANHPLAQAGETYTVLLLNANKKRQIPVCQSQHLALPKKKKLLGIAILRVLPDELMGVALPTPDDLSDRVKSALSGSKSGSVAVVSLQVYTGELETLYDCLSLLKVEEAKEEEADDEYEEAPTAIDMILVVCPKFHGSLHRHTLLAHLLRSKLTKVADTLALQARRGAAAQDPITGSLFEVVVGYLPRAVEKEQDASSDNNAVGDSLVVLLPEEGLDGALANVRGLLKHALAIARGGAHKHKHYHA